MADQAIFKNNSSNSFHNSKALKVQTYAKPVLSTCTWGEKGVALVEAGIVLPIIIFFILISLIEVGNILVDYQDLNQIIREATRLAAQTSNLDNNGPYTSVNYTFTTPTPLDHQLLHFRINHLVNLSNISFNQLTVTTDHKRVGDCGAGTATCPLSLEDSVTVSATLNYKSILPPFYNNLPITVSRSAPWLYGNARPVPAP